MIRDAIELIQDTAVAAAGIKTATIPGDPRRVIVQIGDKYEHLVVPAPVRDHTILGIDDFIAAVNKWGDKGVVYHSHHELVLVVDDADRRDTVTMKLIESETFKFLRTVGNRAMDHRTMVGVLKHQLRGHVIESLLPMVRKLDVSTSDKRSAEIAQGRERGTREFMADLIGAANIPETLSVTTSVYSNAGLRTSRTIACSFDVAIPGLEFTLKPLPDELDIAIEDAQNEIHSILTGALPSTTVLFGEP